MVGGGGEGEEGGWGGEVGIRRYVGLITAVQVVGILRKNKLKLVRVKGSSCSRGEDRSTDWLM